MYYDSVIVNDFLRDTDVYETLVSYCKFLGNKYNETNEGKYRIKYNDLYSVLYSSLNEEKQVEFFNSFATSLNIYPIIKFNNDGIYLQAI